MRHQLLILILGFLLLSVSFATAQRDDDDGGCPTIVDAALEATNHVCDETGVNQLCYGNTLLEIETTDDAADYSFEESGDMVDIGIVRALRSSPMDIENNAWGVSLMRLQAQMENTVPGQAITFLLFGQTEMRTVANEPVVLRAVAEREIKMRSGPSADYAVAGELSPDKVVEAVGRLGDSSWLQIVHPSDDTRVVWVFTALMEIDGELQDLAVYEADGVEPGGLESFYFRTGIGDAQCDESPNSGIMVRTPQGMGEVTFSLNEVEIKLGSTAYIQADEEFTISVVENSGRADVTAFGETTRILSNMQVRVPLGEDGAAAGPPGPPEPCDVDALQGIPADVLGCDWVDFGIDFDCPMVVPAGMDLLMWTLYGRFQSEAEANAAYEEYLASDYSKVLVDGVEIDDAYIDDVAVASQNPSDGLWDFGVHYFWEAPDPGQYVVTLPGPEGTLPIDETHTCEITILEPND